MWNKRLSPGKKLLGIGMFIGAFVLGSPNPSNASGSLAKPSNDSETIQLMDIQIEKIKPQPSVILVNKNLEVVAEFYGNFEVIKEQFNETFENTSLLASYKTQSIYLITAEISKN